MRVTRWDLRRDFRYWRKADIGLIGDARQIQPKADTDLALGLILRQPRCRGGSAVQKSGLVLYESPDQNELGAKTQK